MNFEIIQFVIFFNNQSRLYFKEVSVQIKFFKTPIYEEIKFIVFTTSLSYSVL